MKEQPENTAVWVDESRCKACYDQNAIQGMMIEVINQSTCIGCRQCELHCPDFAIYVAEKGFKFAKLTPESKERAQAIKDNKFMKL